MISLAAVSKEAANSFGVGDVIGGYIKVDGKPIFYSLREDLPDAVVVWIIYIMLDVKSEFEDKEETCSEPVHKDFALSTLEDKKGLCVTLIVQKPESVTWTYEMLQVCISMFTSLSTHDDIRGTSVRHGINAFREWFEKNFYDTGNDSPTPDELPAYEGHLVSFDERSHKHVRCEKQSSIPCSALAGFTDSSFVRVPTVFPPMAAMIDDDIKLQKSIIISGAPVGHDDPSMKKFQIAAPTHLEKREIAKTKVKYEMYLGDGVSEMQETILMRGGHLDQLESYDEFMSSAPLSAMDAPRACAVQSRKTYACKGVSPIFCTPQCVAVCCCCPCFLAGGTILLICAASYQFTIVCREKFSKFRSRDKLKMDEVFADLESWNHLNGLALSHKPRNYLWLLPRLAIALMSAFAGVAVVIPACFMLLLLRSDSVEIKKDKMVRRLNKILKESAKKRAMRLYYLLTRSFPMLFFICGLPIVWVFFVLDGKASELSYSLCLGVQMGLLIIFQLLAFRRSLKNHSMRQDKRIEEIREGIVQQKQVNEYEASKFANLFKQATMVFEAVQFILFALMVALRNKQTEDQPFGKLWENLRTIFFIDLEQYNLEGSVSLISTYAVLSIGSVGFLLLIFSFEYVLDCYWLGYLTSNDRRSEGDDRFFHSFVGAIIYGHGKVENVSWVVSTLTEILCGMLFIPITQKLTLLFCCDYTGAEPTSLVDGSICWEGLHRYYAAGALIALSYYVPLSGMISPMFSKSEGEQIAFNQPWQSFCIVLKLFLVFLASFYTKGDELNINGIIGTGVVSAVLLLVTYMWHKSSMRKLERIATQGVIINTEPGRPLGAIWFQIASFLSGSLGAVGAGVVVSSPEFFRNDIALFGFIFIIGILALLPWYLPWLRSKRYFLKKQTVALKSLASSSCYKHQAEVHVSEGYFSSKIQNV